MKKVLMFIPVMKGGGAERVASLLMNEFHRNGYETEVVITSSSEKDVIRCDLNEEIPLTFLKKEKISVIYRLIGLTASVFCRFFEKFRLDVPAFFAYLSFVSQYNSEIKQIRKILEKNPDATGIAFLQPAIPMLMLASKGLPNRIVFSERGNPERLMKHRYGRKFIEKYYTRADAAVFQTPAAMQAYPDCVSEKGTVISNPIKPDLPKAYHSSRNKYITTFCRISAQKNLPLLFEAFNLLHKKHPDYILRIIGDAVNEEGRAIEKQLHDYIKSNGLSECVIFEPFSSDVHEMIIGDDMYVNSSDYEGISNAMLEAMAIGMPVVCTDCPIGGARATITDGENGLLVPVGDVDSLYNAMKRLIEEDGLSEKLSFEAEKIRYELSLESIAGKWMELL